MSFSDEWKKQVSKEKAEEKLTDPNSSNNRKTNEEQKRGNGR